MCNTTKTAGHQKIAFYLKFGLNTLLENKSKNSSVHLLCTHAQTETDIEDHNALEMTIFLL